MGSYLRDVHNDFLAEGNLLLIDEGLEVLALDEFCHDSEIKVVAIDLQAPDDVDMINLA